MAFARTVQIQQRLDPDGVVRLLSKVLWELPNLPGAACIGRSTLFEDVPSEDPATRAQRLAAAARLCRGCPQRTVCSASLFSRPGETTIPIAG